MSEQNQIFLSLREIIAGLINQDEREIKPESRFLEDLGIELEDAENVIFAQIISRVNSNLGIKFDPELFLDADETNQTVGFLSELIQDEVEL